MMDRNAYQDYESKKNVAKGPATSRFSVMFHGLQSLLRSSASKPKKSQILAGDTPQKPRYRARSTGSLSILRSRSSLPGINYVKSHSMVKSLDSAGDFEKQYGISDTILGKGSSGSVFECTHLESGTKFAVKVLHKQRQCPLESPAAAAFNESAILKSLSHQNLLSLHDLFEDDVHIFIVTPLYSGGDLMTALSELGSFSEEAAIMITHQILLAISYCHKKGVVHRDIKPENVVLKSPGSLRIVVIDFGFAKQASRVEGREQQWLRTLVGSPSYIAPEIIQKKAYSEKCDAWSIGVVFYTLLCQYNPFRGNSVPDIYQSILSEELAFPGGEWSGISGSVKHFISSLLCKNPQNRLHVCRALSTLWLTCKPTLFNFLTSEDSIAT